ncbi:MAG: hypothetical protein ACR2NZ_15740 [Rubripirellula sp.]
MMSHVSKRSSRDGTLVICVLVCLLVASSMVIATTRSALQARRECRVQQQLRQTELLLDAGVRRAAGQLNNDADYQGEQWTLLPIADLTPVIQITVNGDSESRSEIEVVASLGILDENGDLREASRTRRSHRFRVPAPDSTSSNDSSNLSSSAE